MVFMTSFIGTNCTLWPILYAAVSILTYQTSNTLLTWVEWGGQCDSDVLPTSAEHKVPSMEEDV